jgi:two-component system cell cycle sensor histidine kinase/response regulator CckA
MVAKDMREAVRQALRVLARAAPDDEALRDKLNAALAPFAHVSREGGGIAIAEGEHAWGSLVVDVADGIDEDVRVAFVELADDIAAHVQRLGDYGFLRRAIDSIDDAVFLMAGTSPRFRFVNQAAVRRLGYTRDELLQMSVFDIDPTVGDARWRSLVAEAAPTGPLQTVHRRKDGSDVPVEVTRNDFVHDGVLYNVAVARDVAERQRAARALGASARAYSSLVENSPDYLLRWDRTLTRVLVNTAFARSLGKTVADVVGTSFGAQHDPRAQAAVADVESKIREVFATGRVIETEQHLQTVSGVVTCLLRLAPEFDDAGNVVTVLGVGHDITALKSRERELKSLVDTTPDVIVRLKGNEVLFANVAFERLRADDATLADALLAELRASAVIGGGERDVIVGANESPRHFNVRLVSEGGERALAIVRDVTRQRRLEEHLQHAQAMETAGRLAGGLAHDFNNMLAVIQIQAALLSDKRHSADVDEAVGEIQQAAQRAAHLTRQLLTFSRRPTKSCVPLNLSESLSSTARMLRRVLGAGQTLHTHFEAVALVSADPHLIDRAVMNLAVNARDAMGDAGTLTLRVAPRIVDASEAARRPACPAGAYVSVVVEDDGAGIPPEHLKHIFEPFFTTKEAGRGTGLGLATVAAVVADLGGFVDVDSVVGRGTRFELCFRALPAASVGATAFTPHWSHGHEAVLLVEDDATVRATARLALERLGYRVLEADSAASALPLFRARAPQVDLLLTDVILPTCSGAHLADLLQRDDPALPVLFLSGYSAVDVDVDDARMIQQPFSVEELARAVRQALQR